MSGNTYDDERPSSPTLTPYEESVRDQLLGGRTVLGLDSDIPGEDEATVSEKDWVKIKKRFVREFGDDKASERDLEMFLGGVWKELLIQEPFRSNWEERVHELFDIIAPESIDDLEEPQNVCIPDEYIYRRLVGISDMYRIDTPDKILDFLPNLPRIRYWGRNLFDLLRGIVLDTYSKVFNTRYARRLIMRIITRVSTVTATDLTINGGLKLTIDHIYQGDTNLRIDKIVKTEYVLNEVHVYMPDNKMYKFVLDNRSDALMVMRGLEANRLFVALMRHPKLVINLRFFRKLQRPIIESILMKRLGKVYETYVGEETYKIEMNIKDVPDIIRDLLSPDETVLSGGSLIKMVHGTFTNEKAVGVLSELFKNLSDFSRSNDLVRRGDDTKQDYDIYTTRSMEDIEEYFTERGFRNRIPDKEMIEMVQSYGGWLSRYRGPNGEEVDVIHVHRHVTFNRPICRTPQDFIVREFDLDIAKLWFDGRGVFAKDRRTYDNLMARQMTLDFHPGMSINHYKTGTTLKRIIKYENRGFEFVEQDNKQTIATFVKRLERVALFGKPKLSSDRIIEILSHFEDYIISNKDKILEYDRYYVRVREEVHRYKTPIPRIQQVERPEEHLFLATMLRRRISNAGIFDGFFRKTLGISVYQFTGGVYAVRGSSRSRRLMASWKGNITDISPAFLLTKKELSKYRWESPYKEFPRCEEIFTPVSVTPSESFSDKIRKFKEHCKTIEVIEDCKNYLSKINSDVRRLYYHGDDIFAVGSRRGITLSRGMELGAALENIQYMHLPFVSLFVKYLGEQGIDAGGPAKEFLLTVVKQLQPLFDYLDPKSQDPRVYISKTSDESIIETINSELSQGDFNVADLPKMYELAGIMCANAVVNNYSTELPLSRLLLAMMTSADMGVDPDLVTTAFVMEGANKFDDYVMVENDMEGYVEEYARDTYLLEENTTKRSYVDRFAAGFGKMAGVMAFFNVAPHELYTNICSTNINRETFEKFFRDPARLVFKHADPQFEVSLRSGKMVMISGGETAFNVLMRGRSYRFISNYVDDFDMFITDRNDGRVPSVYALLGTDFNYTIPEDSPDVLYLKSTRDVIELSIIDNVEDKDMDAKFLDFMVGHSSDPRLISQLKSILGGKMDVGSMSDDRLIETYYKTVIEYITAFNVIKDDLIIYVDFKQSGLQMAGHSCFKTLDISAPWFATASFEDWLQVIVSGFFEKEFTAA